MKNVLQFSIIFVAVSLAQVVIAIGALKYFYEPSPLEFKPKLVHEPTYRLLKCDLCGELLRCPNCSAGDFPPALPDQWSERNESSKETKYSEAKPHSKDATNGLQLR